MAELDDKLKNSVNERIAAEAQYTSVLSNISAQLKSLAASTDNITKEQNKLVAELKKSKVRTTEVATIQSQLVTKLKNQIADITKQGSQNIKLYNAKQEQIASARDSIAYSKSQISAAEQELSASKKNTTSLREKETVQKSQIAALQQEVATIQNRSKQQVTARKGAPNTSVLTKAEESLVAQLTARKESIRSAFDATVAARKAEISRTAELGVALSDLTNGLPELDNSLSKLQSESTDLSNELRKQAAARRKAKEQLKLEEKAQAEAAKAAAEAAAAAAEFKNKLKTVATGLQSLGEDIKGLADAVYKTQQKFGVSFDTAATIAKGTLIESAKSFFGTATGKGPILSQEEIMAAGQSFMAEFGKVLNPADMARIASEAKKLGVTSDIYVNSRRAFLGTGNEEAVRTRAMSEFANAGLSAGQALQFAAENADLVAVAGDKYAGALFRAAADAKKIGVNLGDVEKFANNLVGDFEGSLEKFAEVTAMGVELDVNQLAAASATGNPEDMINELKKQFTQSGITGEELQNSRQLRLALTQATGMTESAILRLAGQGGKPEEKSMTQQQLDAAKDTNTLLGKLLESGGAIGGIIAKGVTAGLYIANTSALLLNTAALMTNLGGMSALLKTMGSGLGGKAAGVIGGVATGTAIGTSMGASVSGSLVGSGIGTALGAAIGSFIAPGIGTMIGAQLGGMAGGAIAGAMSKKGDDIFSSAGYGARSLVTPTGTVALNNNDTVMAGTKLMSPGALTSPASTTTAPAVNTVNVDMSKLEARFDKLASSLGNLGNMKVEMDGHTVGRVSLNASSPLGRLAVVG